MSATGNRESGGRNLSTADLAAAGRRPPESADRDDEVDTETAARDADDRSDADKPGASRTPRGAAESAGAAMSERPAASPGERSATARSDRPAADKPAMDRGAEQLEPLFPADVAGEYRSRWAAVQSSFVDDPRRAVRQGDELIAQMMKDLAESFATERGRLEAQLGQTGAATTETLRVSLRRYRSFFERLLSL